MSRHRSQTRSHRVCSTRTYPDEVTQASWPELLIDVGRLLRRDNIADLKRRSLDGADVITVDQTVVPDGLAITTARIPDGSEIHVQAELRSTMRGVEASLQASSRWEGECRRCLDLIGEPIEIDTTVSFLPEVFPGDSSSDADADAYPIVGERADLGEALREELLLALPLSPLCAESCEGADPERFPTTGEDASEGDDEGEDAIDPRWAALSALTFDEE